MILQVQSQSLLGVLSILQYMQYADSVTLTRAIEGRKDL